MDNLNLTLLSTPTHAFLAHFPARNSTKDPFFRHPPFYSRYFLLPPYAFHEFHPKAGVLPTKRDGVAVDEAAAEVVDVPDAVETVEVEEAFEVVLDDAVVLPVAVEAEGTHWE